MMEDNDCSVFFRKFFDRLLSSTENDPRNAVLLDFARNLFFQNRFFNENHPVFDHIKSLFDHYTIFLATDELLFRARTLEYGDDKLFGNDGIFQGYIKKESFVPPASKMQANRANADGIPCLYVAKEDRTAIAEIRPFLGEWISIATIKPLKTLRLFNLYFDLNFDFNDNNEPPHFWFWMNLALKFSIPYQKSSNREFLLTQCISEFIKRSGYDGIQYSSSLSEDGKNIALLNCRNEDDGGVYDICEPVSSRFCYIGGIKHYFDYNTGSNKGTPESPYYLPLF